MNTLNSKLGRWHDGSDVAFFNQCKSIQSGYLAALGITMSSEYMEVKMSKQIKSQRERVKSGMKI